MSTYNAKKAPLWLSKCHCVTGADLLGLENQVSTLRERTWDGSLMVVSKSTILALPISIYLVEKIIQILWFRKDIIRES